MSKWLSDPGELERLNAFCAGKTIASLEYDICDNFVLHFTDGSCARLSTLGGFEIEALAEGKT